MGQPPRPSWRRRQVVYADFVPGMMSFFLLVWPIDTTGVICGGGIPRT
jgi:flagellar motor protein MotB